MVEVAGVEPVASLLITNGLRDIVGFCAVSVRFCAPFIGFLWVASGWRVRLPLLVEVSEVLDGGDLAEVFGVEVLPVDSAVSAAIDLNVERRAVAGLAVAVGD